MIARELLRLSACCVLAAALAVTWPSPIGFAQTAPETAAAEPPPEADKPAKLPDEEIDALVTRIALYPDPLLAAVLQASTLPLQIVEASRFLEQHAKDPKVQPKKEWDSSITALLNYDSVVKMMSDDLDWTQELGEAVLNQLADVQDSVQQFRAEVQAAGLLKSDDKQTITTEGDTIKIMPAKAEVIYVPMYDGPALAKALDAQQAAAPAAPPAATDSQAAAAPPPAASSAPAPAAPAPTYDTAAAAPAGAAPAAPAAYPPAYPPPAYPPYGYAPPQPSFWTPGASFVGGALVGGMLGYAIGDNNNDDIEVYHHGDGYGGGGGRNVSNSGNRTVSGNTINNTVNVTPNANRRETTNQAQSALRQRSGQTAGNTQRAQQTRSQINQPGGISRASATPANRQAAQPRARTEQASGTAAARSRGAQQASPPKRDASAFGNTNSGREAKRDSARGAESRQAAQNRAAPQRQQAAAQRPNREQAAGAAQQRQRSGGGGAFANQSSGQRAAAQSNRGSSSRAAASHGGGGRAGGGGGGGRRR